MIMLHIQIQTNTPSLTHTHTLPLRLCTTMMKGGVPMPCYSKPMPNRGEGGIGEYGGFDNWHEHGQGPLTAGCIGQSEGVVAALVAGFCGRYGEWSTADCTPEVENTIVLALQSHREHHSQSHSLTPCCQAAQHSRRGARPRRTSAPRRAR